MNDIINNNNTFLRSCARADGDRSKCCYIDTQRVVGLHKIDLLEQAYRLIETAGYFNKYLVNNTGLFLIKQE